VEARCLGADAVLLILAALSDADAASLEGLAHALGMDVLVEVHNPAELGRALRLQTPLIGINNRDLRSLTVDLGTTERLAPLIPTDRLIVSESGINSAADLVQLQAVGATCFLVGEALARQPDAAAATAALLAGAAATITQSAQTG
jgi:indole-3-glycerol phosphate synthase